MAGMTVEGDIEQLDFPADDAEVIVPSDVTGLVKISRSIYIGGAGDVSVEMAKTGTAIVFTGVQAGSVLPIRVSRVNATGTTATNMVALS